MASKAKAIPEWLGTLTTAEQALWDAFPLGNAVDLRAGDKDLDDVATADTWPDRRRIRADVVTALLLGARSATPGRLAAVRLQGALIIGDVDLDNCDVAFPMSIAESRISLFTANDATTRSIMLRGSRIDAFSMTDSRLTGVLDLRDCSFVDPISGPHRINIEGTEISGSVLMSRVLVHGIVRCAGSVIKRTMRLADARLLNGSHRTLEAPLLTTGNQVFARQLYSQGQIDLADARLGGRLVLDGALLENSGGVTLSARRMSVGGELSMRKTTRPFVSIGRIMMSGSRIDGTVGMQESVLREPTGAFHASGMSVARSLRLAGADIEGTVAVPGAIIGDQLDLSGAWFTSPELYAFSGHGISVAKEVRLELHTLSDGMTREFRSNATVHLDGATIGGNVRVHGAHLAATGDAPVLNMSSIRAHGVLLKDGLTTTGEIRMLGARIDGHLNLSGMTSPEAHLMLYGAAITEVFDDGKNVWPGRLHLDGFTYEALAPYRPAAERVNLLKRQVDGYRARPYEQLAAYYRRLGHDDEARAVLLSRQRARRDSLPPWRRIPGYISDLLAGYGYRPSRAIGWAAGLMAVGSLYFSHNPPRPVHPVDHPVFNPVIYTADQLIPLVRLGTADTWQPQGTALAIASGLTVFGWALSIAIAAAATRTLSRS